MSTEEIDEIIAPSAESQSLVMDWLKSQGLGAAAKMNWRGNTILVDTTVDKVEDLLHTEYKNYCMTCPRLDLSPSIAY